MSNKKQTAVEWLIEQINQDYPEMTWAYKEECKQAKEIEKQQIIDAIDLSYDYKNWSKDLPTKGQQYYNETYK